MGQKQLYRPNVAMIIVSQNYPNEKKLFIAHRSDLEGIWQFPQGGIDEGEGVQEALFRELEEEIGTNKATIVSEYPEWLSYDFPEKIAQKMQPYKGQRQRYFLVKLQEDASINLETEHPEFNAYKFVDVAKALEMSAHFKKPVYEKVIEYFKEEGYL